MPSLRESQEELRDAILAHARHADAGVEAYRYAYGARLVQTLRANYPVLAERLGADAFVRIARRYVASYPSQHYNIRWYGAHLWRMLDGPYADLARMEWALGLAFDAEDRPALTWEALKSTPVDDWAELPLALHPSTQVLALSWAIAKMWEHGAEPRRQDGALLVWRKNLQAHWRVASHAEAAALRALRLGTLASACAAIPEADAEQLGAWFAGWVTEGMVAPGSLP
jgi:hypothetical protein